MSRKLRTIFNPLLGKRFQQFDEGIENHQLMEERTGSIRTGIKINRNPDLTFSLSAGDFVYYDAGTDKVPTPFSYPGANPVFFEYFTPDGNILPGLFSDIDPNNFWNGLTIAPMPNNDWSQQPIAMNYNTGEVIVGYGKQVFVNAPQARQRGIYEDLELPVSIAALGFVLIGSINIQEGELFLTNTNVYLRIADKYGQLNC